MNDFLGGAEHDSPEGQSPFEVSTERRTASTMPTLSIDDPAAPGPRSLCRASSAPPPTRPTTAVALVREEEEEDNSLPSDVQRSNIFRSTGLPRGVLSDTHCAAFFLHALRADEA